MPVIGSSMCLYTGGYSEVFHPKQSVTSERCQQQHSTGYWFRCAFFPLILLYFFENSKPYDCSEIKMSRFCIKI